MRRYVDREHREDAEYGPDYDEYQDAVAEGKQLDSDQEVEDAWEDARGECVRQARDEFIQECKALGFDGDQIDIEMDKVEDDFKAAGREIFDSNIDNYIDPCRCSDPCCPCTGTKKGRP